MGCGNTPEIREGRIVYVSKDVSMWGQIPAEDLDKPLKEYEGRDILTPETGRNIYENNERLSN